MKKLTVFIICLMWSFTCTSQDLKPIVHHTGNEKYFCFTIEQSKFIAERLEFGLFQDSLVSALKLDNLTKAKLVSVQETLIFKLEEKVTNLSFVKQHDKMQIEILNATLVKQNRKIKRSKLERWVFGGGLLILTGIIIAK